MIELAKWIGAVSLIFWAGLGLAQDWQELDGKGISAALSGKVLDYGNAKQEFFVSGRTVYEAGEPSWGNWAVRSAQYCSTWPPSDKWDCYDMTRAGNLVRFIDSSGNVTEGAIIP